MPGRSPSEAFGVFVEPLAEAVGCLGRAKFTASPGGRGNLHVVHSLLLNGGGPLLLSGGLQLSARVLYEIIRDGTSAAQPFRITTRAYMHTIALNDGVELLTAHWHPVGASPQVQPHWHVGAAALAPDGVFTPRAHIPSGRIAFETIVRVAIEQFGVEPTRSDWAEVLDRCEHNFTEHRSWPS